ncbi:hypothetical protein SKAU_G00403150 [Synaphobranchus kaupii]|uniref:Uncharacterized protein n=1 Tax=Synaphobranchus kaupii TaxID=118154 RepID=A0A9Q1E9G1_SYNKA|nr:hypothetical protein SKAU_G00403150 [Synaphobranchus kaupii]
MVRRGWVWLKCNNVYTSSELNNLRTHSESLQVVLQEARRGQGRVEGCRINLRDAERDQESSIKERESPRQGSPLGHARDLFETWTSSSELRGSLLEPARDNVIPQPRRRRSDHSPPLVFCRRVIRARRASAKREVRSLNAAMSFSGGR